MVGTRQQSKKMKKESKLLGDFMKNVGREKAKNNRLRKKREEWTRLEKILETQEIRQDDKKIGKSLPGKELIIKFLSRNNQIFSLL